MADIKFPHYFLDRPPDNKPFTPSAGGSRPSLPTRNREEHSQRLLQQFREAWATAEQDTISLKAREGVYLEFKSQQGYELPTHLLENRQQKIRFLSKRTEGAGEEQTTFSAVYVPADKNKYFIKKIEEYAQEETKNGNPKHQELIASIQSIKLAMVKSLWQDESPIPSESKDWCEVWLFSNDDDVEVSFRELLSEVQVESKRDTLKFPERQVLLIWADVNDMTNLLSKSPDIAEFRLAKETASFWMEQTNVEQTQWVDEILARSEFQKDSNVSICVLDTGVNNGHRLIAPALVNKDMFTYDPNWGVSDSDGHGTLMSGLCLYGDLVDVLNHNQPLFIEHILESGKILPPTGSNPKELWGFITCQTVSRAEIENPGYQRILCMAITSTEDRDRGKPSSWSGATDAFCSGYDDNVKRLIIVSAGNIPPEEFKEYPNGNATNSVHDPAQSWNALTVGAFTNKQIIQETNLSHYTPLAPKGGLSPFSSTSTTWKVESPIKPDIVMEGGNVAMDEGSECTVCDSLSLLSTYQKPQERQFDIVCATSASCALAAKLAAEIQVANPSAWPETVRALMVHFAEWPDGLKKQFLNEDTKTNRAKMLRICGYGVPNRDLSIQGDRNHFTMIAQQSIQPFELKKTAVTKEMHLIQLPWPYNALEDLGEMDIEIRITLSYFIEPSPGEVGWDNKFRYPSHGLRFDLQSPTEDQDQFIHRINKAVRKEGEKTQTDSQSDRWFFGKKSQGKGSLIHDRWCGSAAEIASAQNVAVYPTAGWWKTRKHLNCVEKQARYSLVVSLATPEERTNINIYSMIANKIGIPIHIQT
ncbi:S8 family serine peptidase [bacterium]|nr:S8 family serine peptidase [bacterium]